MFENANLEALRNSWQDWLLRGVLGLVFVAVGADKFPSRPDAPWVKLFDQIGLVQWFRYFTGVVEASATVLILIPRTVTAGLALFGSAMAGAVIAWIFVLGQPLNCVVPGGFLIGLTLFWLNRRGR